MPRRPPTGSYLRSGKRLLAANPIGLVPIHWPAPVPETADLLGEIHRLGFEGIQLGDQVEAGASSHETLGRHRLRVAEVYAALPCSPSGPGSDALEIGRSRLEMLKAGGGDVLVTALDGSPDRARAAGRADRSEGTHLTRAGWGRLAELLDTLARETAAAGHRMSFHPHSGTYVETPAEVDQILAETDPSLVGLCLDTGHCIVGGGDPVAVVDHQAERINHVHLKDVSPLVLEALRAGDLGGLEDALAARIFCPLGSGVLDLAGVLLALDRVGHEGWLMVEQDTSWEPPAEASAISRRVLAWAQRHLGEHHIGD